MSALLSLLFFRVDDNSKIGFSQWAFLTTHSWGESSHGEWILEISNGFRSGKS